MADLGWEDDDVSWGGVELSSKQFAPVYVNTTEFYILGYDSSTALDTLLERQAVVHIPGRDVIGTAVWPEIYGPSGFSIQISMGAQDDLEGAIDWEGPYNFVIGTDEFQDFSISGRYLAVKFESTGIPAWYMPSFRVEYEVIGKRSS